MPLRNTTLSERPIESSPTRRGFTLIELLVALLLLDVGLLALVGFAAALYRDGNDTRGLARAWAIASARVERMASASCGGVTAGSATYTGGVSEWFSDAPSRNETRILADSVRLATSRGVVIASLRTAARC